MDNTDTVDQEIILLGITQTLPLTQRRYQLIQSKYGSCVEAAYDSFQCLQEKDFDQLKTLTYELVYSRGLQMLETMNRENSSYCSILSDAYPQQLKVMADYPVLLYYRGDISTVHMQKVSRTIHPTSANTVHRDMSRSSHYAFLGCVGSRAIIPQVEIVIDKLLQSLKGYPISIVSGLAVGVDSCAHRKALTYGFPCVGVLGTSVCETEYYPRATLGLSRQIVEAGGVIVSEYPAGSPRMKHNFVRRNRLIAALSDAVLVTQAQAHSGSCTTAEYAWEYDKSVLATAGLPFDDIFLGNHALLKAGAKLVVDGDDIITQLGFEQLSRDLLTTNNSVERIGHATSVLELTGVSQTAQCIFGILSFSPLSIDTIMHSTQLTMHQVTTDLSLLELRGYAKHIGSNCWIKSR